MKKIHVVGKNTTLFKTFISIAKTTSNPPQTVNQSNQTWNAYKTRTI